MVEISFKEPLFICTGEPSGDLYAALLIKKIREKNSETKIYGVGGDQMRRSGIDVVEDYNKLMTFGFAAGIFSCFRNYKIFRKIAREMYQVRPKTFIAVAYPGMNLLLCRYAKKLGCKIYYFLPPQIWAWGTFRKYFIKKWVDMVVSVFPFEYEFYKSKAIKTEYLENPLFEELKKYKRDDLKKRIGFMPGSRINEIKRNLPVMVEFMKKINQEKAEIEFYLILLQSLNVVAGFSLRKNKTKLNSISQPEGCDYTKTLNVLHKGQMDDALRNSLKVITENRHQAMKNCDLLIISSGTASLEAAIMNVPQIFFNRPSFFDYYILKKFLKVKEYNLANIYFNKRIVSSFVSRNRRDVLQKLMVKLDIDIY